MDGEFCHKEGPLRIGMEYRFRRSVRLDSTQYLGDASTAPFGHIQFLEELSDPAIAISPADEAENFKILITKGS